MTTDRNALIQRAEALAAKAGSWNAAVIPAIIDAGVVPEGAVIATGSLNVRAFAARLEQYDPSTGEIVKSVPMTDSLRISTLVQYAARAAYVGRSMINSARI